LKLSNQGKQDNREGKKKVPHLVGPSLEFRSNPSRLPACPSWNGTRGKALRNRSLVLPLAEDPKAHAREGQPLSTWLKAIGN